MMNRKPSLLGIVAPIRWTSVVREPAPVAGGPRATVLVFLILILGLLGLWSARRADLRREAFVVANNQSIVGGTVTVDRVRSVAPGWIVIRRSADGVMGNVIGFTPVPAGDSVNLIVPINVGQATVTMFAVLHEDLGTPRVFEYPGPDDMVIVGGQPVMDTFQVLEIVDDGEVLPPVGGEPTPIPPLATPVTPIAPPLGPQSIWVIDQPVVNETVTVQRVVAFQQSWLTIHNDDNGHPGMILGAEPVAPGESVNIVIPINVNDITPRLHAALYADLGIQGAFEIPGADTPVLENGQWVTDSFLITGGIPIILPPGGGLVP